MESTYDKHKKKKKKKKKKNPYFFVTTEPNRIGIFAEMQILISYSFIILKHIQIDLSFWKLLRILGDKR